MPTPAQRLLHSVRTRNHERLRELIRQENSLVARTAAGRTALHAAAEEGDRVSAAILIEAGADVNARMCNGQTPLHLAAAHGGACDLADPDVERQPCSGRRNRPLTPEAAKVFTEIIKDMDPSLPSSLEPWDEIPEEHKADAFCATFDLLADPARVLKEFTARGIDLDRLDLDMAEHLRGNPRFLGLVELLFTHGADIHAVDNYGASVLKGAVELGSLQIVELLLKSGAVSNRQSKPDQQRESLFEAALERSRIDVADALLRHGVELNSNACGLLYGAATNGRLSSLLWLLDHGADINLRDDGGNTPLLAAMKSGHENIMAALIARGADAHVRNPQGNGVLHVAAQGLGCLQPALRLGLPVNEPNGQGQTALHLAAPSAEPSVLQSLLRAGADVNLRDHAGNTPLHALFSSDEFRPDVEFPAFLTLVTAGADRSLQNCEHNTAFALAIQYDYPEEYLRLLDPDTPIASGQFIWLGDDAYAGFLPKALVSFELEGVRWPSAWHYFHAQKTDDPEICERIRQAPTVEAAKGRLCDAKVDTRNLPSRCDAIMRAALLTKFQQNPDLCGQLLATGDAVLICDASCESYWLECRGAEFNALGKMLMNIRAELRVTSKEASRNDH